MSAPTDERPSFRDVSSLLHGSDHFISTVLHDCDRSKNDRTKEREPLDRELDRLAEAKYLAGRRRFAFRSREAIDSSFRLNVLIVDNAPFSEVHGFDPDGWQRLAALPIDLFFLHFKDDRLQQSSKVTVTNLNFNTGKFKDEGKEVLIAWCDVDLILQDVHLGADQALGYDLARQYAHIAPQALVFLLTSLPLEALAASRAPQCVDGSIPKHCVRTLPWDYHQRFTDLFGTLLWEPWITSSGSGPRTLTDRTSLRGLLGSLRRWKLEPEILFHGYALPEMVDHAFRHTSGLWDTAQKILPALQTAAGCQLTSEDLILLCLGIWLHDVGHVGNEHFIDSDSIRRFHGSISDRLLLEMPDALGLDWLHRFCVDDRCKVPSPGKARVARANQRTACAGDVICPLRRAGLLARYHQSSAPVLPSDLKEIVQKGKPLTPYCRVPLALGEGAPLHEAATSPSGVNPSDDWLDDTKPLGWLAHTVRTLHDFGDTRLIALEWILRWLDGLHLHSCRIGIGVRQDRMKAFLTTREEATTKRIELAAARIAEVGRYTDDGIRLQGEVDALTYYRQLLRAQDIHHWLHGCVRDITAEHREQRLIVSFELDRDAVDNPKLSAEHFESEYSSRENGNPDAWVDLWTSTVAGDFIEKEVNSIRRGLATELILCESLRKIIETILDAKHLATWKQAGDIQTKNLDTKNSLPDVHLPIKFCVAPPFSGAALETANSDRHLALDCDPGVDDALAIFLATRLFASVQLSAVAGNVGLEQTFQNARLLAAIATPSGRPEIRIVRGASRSLLGDRPSASSVHGRDGLGEVPLDQSDWRHLKIPGEADSATLSAGEILRLALLDIEERPVFVFTGPLTNLALALLQASDPNDLIKRLGRVVVMGGAFDEAGNITPGAEFNCFFDPLAVHVVLKFYAAYQREMKNGPLAGLFFVPLDVTERVQLCADWIIDPDPTASLRSRWSQAALERYFAFHASNVYRFEAIDWSILARPIDKLEPLTFKPYEDLRREADRFEHRGQGSRDLLKPLRFCHLHDPLAVWTSRKLHGSDSKAWLEKFSRAQVAIHKDPGELRGYLQVIEKDGRPRRPPLTEGYRPGGASIWYLDPGKFTIGDYRDLLEALFSACEWRVKKQEGPTDDQPRQ